jgi:hypothetical protein
LHIQHFYRQDHLIGGKLSKLVKLAQQDVKFDIVDEIYWSESDSRLSSSVAWQVSVVAKMERWLRPVYSLGPKLTTALMDESLDDINIMGYRLPFPIIYLTLPDIPYLRVKMPPFPGMFQADLRLAGAYILEEIKSGWPGFTVYGIFEPVMPESITPANLSYHLFAGNNADGDISTYVSMFLPRDYNKYITNGDLIPGFKKAAELALKNPDLDTIAAKIGGLRPEVLDIKEGQLENLIIAMAGHYTDSFGKAVLNKLDFFNNSYAMQVHLDLIKRVLRQQTLLRTMTLRAALHFIAYCNNKIIEKRRYGDPPNEERLAKLRRRHAGAKPKQKKDLAEKILKERTKVVIIGVDPTMEKRYAAGTRQGGRIAGPSITHPRRGTWRRYKNKKGKEETVWVRATIVNADNPEYIVRHRYKFAEDLETDGVWSWDDPGCIQELVFTYVYFL